MTNRRRDLRFRGPQLTVGIPHLAPSRGLAAACLRGRCWPQPSARGLFRLLRGILLSALGGAGIAGHRCYGARIIAQPEAGFAELAALAPNRYRGPCVLPPQSCYGSRSGATAECLRVPRARRSLPISRSATAKGLARSSSTDARELAR